MFGSVQRSSLASSLVMLLTVAGCGAGGSDAPPSQPQPGGGTTVITPGAVPLRQGQFIDSPVQGLSYRAGSSSGTTDADGSFQYPLGETVIFSVADIEIGRVEGQAIVTPLDLVAAARDASHPQVLNIARFLQALDSDANPNNGIQIPEAVRQARTGLTLDFSLPTAQFDSAAALVLKALPDLSGRVLVTADAAKSHLVDYVNGYRYLMSLRRQAGMIDLAKLDALALAASNHTDYLLANPPVIGHAEISGLPKFTGSTPADRAIAAGYSSRYVVEGISDGDSAHKAIDNLMSGIYHRLDLLSFTHDQIGIGLMRQEVGVDGTVMLVHNMGNSKLNTLCQQGQQTLPPGNYYTNVCATDINIAEAVYNGALTGIRQQNPAIVRWPPENGTDIPPAFFEETPDPLPDYSVSGYPVSIQFNPHYFTAVEVISFELYDEIDQKIETRLLDINTDPNPNPDTRLTALEYALYPLQRLKWAGSYRAEVRYSVAGVVQPLESWRFTTRALDVPVITVASDANQIELKSGIEYAIYVPPTNGSSALGSVNVSYPAGMKVFLDYEDQDTLRLTLSGSTGQQASLTFGGGRRLTMVLVGQ